MILAQQIKSISTYVVAVMLVLNTTACLSAPASRSEILIGLTVEAAPLIFQPKQPDPANTGIPSLDALNQKWQVQQMIPLFPDVSPNDAAAVRHGLAGIYKLVVPKGTDLNAMIQEYEADPNVAYAEVNKPVETK